MKSWAKPSLFLSFIIVVCIFSLLWIAILSDEVSAIGLSPGLVIINYTPNQALDIPWVTYNGGDAPLYIKMITGDGDLTQYISCPQEKEPSFAISPGAVFTAECKITVPEGALAPGYHEGYYGFVTTTPPMEATAGGGATVGIQMGSLQRVEMIVPYPEKYVYVTYSFENILEGNQTPYTVTIKNLGLKVLYNVSVTIQLIDPDGTALLTLPFESVPLITNQDKTFMGTLETQTFYGGRYTAKLLVLYDGEQAEYNTTLRIGNKMLYVTDFPEITLPLDGISRIPFTVESNWIEGVYGYAKLVLIKNAVEKINVTTDTQLIPSVGNGNGTLTAFIDPEEEGTYDVLVTTFVIDGVTKTEIFKGYLYVKSKYKKWIYVSVALALVLINILLYLLRKRKKHL